MIDDLKEAVGSDVTSPEVNIKTTPYLNKTNMDLKKMQHHKNKLHIKYL